MITLEPIYRDVMSKLDQTSFSTKVTSRDVLISINDAIASLRDDYVSKNLGQSFSITEETIPSVRDTLYPFLFVSNLSFPTLKKVGITKSILNVTAFLSSTQILDKTQTALFETTAYHVSENGFVLCKCVKAFENLNTFQRIFEASSLRQWRQSNGLKYFTGDVIFDGTSYWRLTSDLINNQEYTFVESGAGAGQVNAQQVYWKIIGEAVANPVFIEFDRIMELRIMDRNGFLGYTVKENEIYGTKSIKKLIVTYVPEWSYVDDLKKEIKVPYELIQSIVDLSISRLAIKFATQQGSDETR